MRPSLLSNSIWKVGGLCALDVAPALRELGNVAIELVEFLFEDEPREEDDWRALLPVVVRELL